jgi:hypothetical protein
MLPAPLSAALTPATLMVVASIATTAGGTMGKTPIRLKEVTYMLSPFQQSVMTGLWKDLPHKAAHHATVVRGSHTGVARHSQIPLQGYVLLPGYLLQC